MVRGSGRGINLADLDRHGTHVVGKLALAAGGDDLEDLRQIAARLNAQRIRQQMLDDGPSAIERKTETRAQRHREIPSGTHPEQTPCRTPRRTQTRGTLTRICNPPVAPQGEVSLVF